jgi:hypothetical protein
LVTSAVTSDEGGARELLDACRHRQYDEWHDQHAGDPAADEAIAPHLIVGGAAQADVT